MKVQDIMTREPACCVANDRLRTVAQLMDEFDCGAIPVVEDQESLRPVGVVTDRDIVIRVVAAGENCQEARVKQAMTSSVVTVSGETDIHEAERLMKERQLRRLVVVDEDGRCTGMLSQADLARHVPDDEAGDVVEEISEPNAIG